MANKPLGFPFGFFTNDNTPTDGKYYNRETLKPYTSISEAKTLLPLGIRYGGLTVNIAGIEYWWRPDWEDLNQDPVIKFTGAKFWRGTIVFNYDGNNNSFGLEKTPIVDLPMSIVVNRSIILSYELNDYTITENSLTINKGLPLVIDNQSTVEVIVMVSFYYSEDEPIPSLGFPYVFPFKLS